MYIYFNTIVLFDNSYLGSLRRGRVAEGMLLWNICHTSEYIILDLPERSKQYTKRIFFKNLQVPELRLSFRYVHLCYKVLDWPSIHHIFRSSSSGLLQQFIQFWLMLANMSFVVLTGFQPMNETCPHGNEIRAR